VKNNISKLACFIAVLMATHFSWASGGTCTPPFNTTVFGSFGGVLSDVGMGQDGTVWSIGSSGVELVVRGNVWTGGSILGAPGGQTTSVGRRAAGPDGSPWAVDDNNHIWHYILSTGSWQAFTGLARDIAVTPDGTPWVVGTQSTSGGFHIYFWNGSSWVQISGAGTRIAAGPGTDTQPWVVNSSNNIFHRNSNGSFTQLPGAGSDIGVDLTDTPWVIGTNTVTGGFEVYHFVGGIWQGDPNVGAVALTGGNQGLGSGCGAYILDNTPPNRLVKSTR